MYTIALNHSRTLIGRNRWQLSLVMLTACLPSSICRSACPACCRSAPPFGWAGLVALSCQYIFERDRKERVPELGWVMRIPEERMVGVGADTCCKAWIGNVGKSEMGWIRFNCIEEAEYIHSENVVSLQQFFEAQQVVLPRVGCRACRRGKADIPRRRRQQTYIEEIGNDEMPGAARRSNNSLAEMPSAICFPSSSGVPVVVSRMSLPPPSRI